MIATVERGVESLFGPRGGDPLSGEGVKLATTWLPCRLPPFRGNHAALEPSESAGEMGLHGVGHVVIARNPTLAQAEHRRSNNARYERYDKWKARGGHSRDLLRR